ncbi:hypothetical protein NBRC116187_33180 [Halopseudomonas sabulinigri]|uniref:Uncharacterized protein n=1 Tax=Halopseudomonas sabulinigri TaxID=472181 RepID=A0ABP9ZU35_9GAMM
MHEFGIHPGDGGDAVLQAGEQLAAAKIGKGWGSTQDMHVGNGLGDAEMGKRRRIGYLKPRQRAMPGATALRAESVKAG